MQMENMFYFTYKTTVKSDLDSVWGFYKTSECFKSLTPSFLQTNVLQDLNDNDQMSEGKVQKIEMSFYGLKLGWITMITEVKEQSYFKEICLKGPFRKWVHVHVFKDIAEGVLVIDEISYLPPFGRCNGIMNMLFIKPVLKLMFQYRHRMLKNLISF